jgi:hypothetical protein
MNDIPVSGDVSTLPQRSDMIVSALAEASLPRNVHGEVAVTGQQAIEVTLARWGLSYSDIDPEVGAVRALWSRAGNSHAPRKVWIVTANADSMSQGPARSRHYVQHKLCTVIDATTGEYYLAYSCGPSTFVDEE